MQTLHACQKVKLHSGLCMPSICHMPAYSSVPAAAMAACMHVARRARRTYDQAACMHVQTANGALLGLWEKSCTE